MEPIVPIIFQRVKATCFAYGQTGDLLSVQYKIDAFYMLAFGIFFIYI